MPINYSEVRDLLNSMYEAASANTSELANTILEEHHQSFDTVFNSKTQSYREVLLGCALIHCADQSVNIRHPYMNQGPDAFNGRTLDEQVVNPFLVFQQIPCSKGPYLATFRRNVKLDESTKGGLRDKIGYEAMLQIIELIENSADVETSKAIVIAILKCFIALRERSIIPIASLARLSVEQYRKLIFHFLTIPSGGLIPMLLTEALFCTINEQFSCGWEVIRQGINAADGATGAPGDVTIKKDNVVIKAIEVTERPIHQARVDSTFSTKIIIHNIRDYLFLYTGIEPEDGCFQSAKRYFAQGYDINFCNLNDLIISVFIAGDSSTRESFSNKMVSLLSSSEVPASVKTAWNQVINAILTLE